MFVCNECGKSFPEPDTKWSYGMGALGTLNWYPTNETCPYCGSGDYDEVKPEDEFDE